MKKYWFIPTGNKVWLQAAISLYNSKIAVPVLWTGDDRHYNSAKLYFGDAVFSKQKLCFYPEELETISYDSNNCEFFLSENYIRAKDRCLKMMDRLDLYGNFSRLDRDAMFNKLVLWLLFKFDQTEPEALITSENPHSHTHYLIYEICLYKKIEIMKFNTWLPIPVLYGQEQFSRKRLKVSQNLPKELSDLLDRKIEDFVDKLTSTKYKGTYILPAIKQQKNDVKLLNLIIGFLRSGLILQIKEFWFQFRKYFTKNYYPINPYKLNYFTRNWIKYQRKKNLTYALKRFSVKEDLKKDFVYFALSYEPERTTNPDGGEFHDQIIALTFLRKFVPKNYLIYIKEHPTQFLKADKGSRGRSPIFYEAIRNIQGTYLVNSETDSLELIKRSKFTASISGSVAFEAAIIGKRSLVFGDTWYEGCPNIKKWSPDLNFKDFINSKLSRPNSIKEFLIDQKNTFCIIGCQNISAEKRFSNFLNEKFRQEELRGVTYLMKKFLLKNKSNLL